jgi:hypothetical protein
MAYDPRAVKVSKSVKRLAATITDPHLRRSLIKSYARVEEVNSRMRSSRGRGNKEE